MAKIINFTSSFNGSGKSCLLTVLARQLEEENQRVLIIDNSWKVSRLPNLFGLPRFEKNMGDLKALCRLSDFKYAMVDAYITKLSPEISVIGCSKGDIADPGVVSRIIDLVSFRGEYDYILIESPSRCTLRNALNVFVIEPRVDVYKSLAPQGNVVVVNKYTPECGVTLKQLGKNVMSLPYAPGMVLYEMGKVSAIDDEFWDAFEYFRDVLEEDYALWKRNNKQKSGQQVIPEEEETMSSRKVVKAKPNRAFNHKHEEIEELDNYDEDEEFYDEYDEDGEEEEELVRKSKTKAKDKNKTKRMGLFGR